MMRPSNGAGRLATLAALALAFALPSAAFAHSVAGNRIFPATLAIDDPGVDDELALPTFTYLPFNADGIAEYDFSFEFDKRITPNLQVSVDDALTRLAPGGWSVQNLGLGIKYLSYVNAEHEFMASIGLDSEVGGTGTTRVGADPFSTLTPNVYFGKGLGDLPISLNLLRPFAITGQIGTSIPTDSRTTTSSIDPVLGVPVYDTESNATTFNYGFTLQYSLPYMNANVREVGGPDFLKHLIPIVEAQFGSPVANTMSGQRETTGTVQPGAIYLTDTYQIAVEAVVPINRASGHNVGVVAELHFFFDDIFPDSIGKPIFP